LHPFSTSDFSDDNPLVASMQRNNKVLNFSYIFIFYKSFRFNSLEGKMFKTVEATIDTDGHVDLKESVHLLHSCRAFVTIIDVSDVSETSLLSEAALAVDWEKPEEDAAWSHLQQGQ
jgi:hypothetical protein